jgi:hypothetical protein
VNHDPAAKGILLLGPDPSQEAERQGLDFVLAMAKYRGMGGESGYWEACLDSFPLMAAIGAATSRIQLFPTVSVLSLHPAVAARMIATISDITGGRCGLNIVSGWNKPEFEQMGMWPGDEFFQRRYEYAAEYVDVLKLLWQDGQSVGAKHRCGHRRYTDARACAATITPMGPREGLLVIKLRPEAGARGRSSRAAQLISGPVVASVAGAVSAASFAAERIVEGTRCSPFVSDIAINDQMIVEVRQIAGSATGEIDATGLTVTPGFVDIHMLYDGHATWTNRLYPSSHRGVTTIVMGNCGVGFSACRLLTGIDLGRCRGHTRSRHDRRPSIELGEFSRVSRPASSMSTS